MRHNVFVGGFGGPWTIGRLTGEPVDIPSLEGSRHASRRSHDRGIDGALDDAARDRPRARLASLGETRTNGRSGPVAERARPRPSVLAPWLAQLTSLASRLSGLRCLLVALFDRSRSELARDRGSPSSEQSPPARRPVIVLQLASPQPEREHVTCDEATTQRTVVLPADVRRVVHGLHARPPIVLPAGRYAFCPRDVARRGS